MLAIDPDAVRLLAEQFERGRRTLDGCELAIRAALGRADLVDPVPWRLQDRGDGFGRASMRLHEAARQVEAVPVEYRSFDGDGLWELRLTLVLARGVADGRADLGGTLRFAERSAFAIPTPPSSRRPVEAGRAAVGWSLAAAADADLIAADEFGLLDHGGHRYTLVLPGVTDLSRPDPGYSTTHRSARDLDQGAIPSFGSTDIAPYSYAGLVARTALAELPPDAEVCIVGHSFGADVAADLAADPRFSGPDGVRITHVVLAGYDSADAVAELDPDLPVLVLRNVFDLPVLVEEVVRDPLNPLGALPLPRDRTEVERNHVSHSFVGGLGGAGHHPSHYADAIAEADHPAIERFLASLAANGFAEDGVAWAVDVSVP